MGEGHDDVVIYWRPDCVFCLDLLLRLKSEGRLSIAMIMHNYAQTLDIADRIILMQHGRITYEKAAAATSVQELMEIVRREYRAMRVTR